VACYLQAVNLLICEWTFHWPIGYSVAMTRHAFLVGEVINELYLQTKHFFISQHLKNLYILLYDRTTNCGLDVQIRFLIFTTWILHTSVPEYIDQKRPYHASKQVFLWACMYVDTERSWFTKVYWNYNRTRKQTYSNCQQDYMTTATSFKDQKVILSPNLRLHRNWNDLINH
jgi:hypothetical protein